MRPNQFTKVKPGRAAPAMMSRSGQVCVPLSTNCTSVELLSQIVQNAGKRGYSAKRRKRRNIPPLDSSSPPPDTESEHNRQHDRGRLAYGPRVEKRPATKQTATGARMIPTSGSFLTATGALWKAPLVVSLCPPSVLSRHPWFALAISKNRKIDKKIKQARLSIF